MSIRKKWVAKSSAVVAAAIAALALVAVPQVSAASSVKGYSEDPTAFGSLTKCQNIFTGPATADNDSGGIVARIDNVTFNFCQAGTSVTPKALPWTLELSQAEYTIEGFAVDVTTPRGTCRYSGTVAGVMQFPGVYDLRGLLTRQSGGCVGPEQLNISNAIEVIGSNG